MTIIIDLMVVFSIGLPIIFICNHISNSDCRVHSYHREIREIINIRENISNIENISNVENVENVEKIEKFECDKNDSDDEPPSYSQIINHKS